MTEPASARAPFRADINGLRALSVVLVVLYHVGLKGASGGFVGVDVFFVISGFLMTGIVERGLEAGTFRYGQFLAARAARIWPALGATILASLVAGAFLLPPSDLRQVARQAGTAVLFWSNRFFRAHGGYDTDGADGNWFLHTWSLSVEWQFYMLYPLVLVAVARLAARLPGRDRAGGARSSAAPWVVGALAAASFVRYVVVSPVRPDDAFFLLTSRAWQMAAGGLAYWAARAASPGRWRATLSSAGVVLVGLAAAYLDRAHVAAAGLGWRSALPVAGAALVLWANDADNRLLRNPWIQRVGSASYSIYLWHWPLVVAAEISGVTSHHPVAAKAVVVAASLLLGWLSFKLVETPWRRGRAAARVPAQAIALLAGAGVAVLVVTATRGLAFRTRGGADVAPVAESDYYPDRCGNFLSRAEDLRTCTLTRDERRRVLVIGDSHAEHLWAWFEAASKVSVDFLTEAECPPIPNFERLQPGFHCLDYARAAWDAGASPRYDTVIVSARWLTVGGVGPPYCHREASGACPVVANMAERQALARDELRGVIESLLARGKTVVVFDETPEAPFKVPQRLERERFWFGAPRLVIDRATLDADAWLDGMFAELARRPGFHLVSLRPKLCDAHTCRVYDDAQVPIYFDASHFVPAWIIRNGDVFAPFVQTARTL
jgi:peptidoglycan/LPS O-acetylase OafA/YrhL